MSQFEERLRSQGVRRIAGVDEAGRGPLAGPVVAAACILPDSFFLEDLNDSKQLKPEKRDELYHILTTHPEVKYAVASIDAAKIDEMNILQATFLAMQQAVAGLSEIPDYLLIDGNQLPKILIPALALVEGDARSVSIAAASILAKVTRDRILEQLDAEYPLYGFKKHKGYATLEHRQAIEKYGPCQIHRKSFEPIKSLLEPNFFNLLTE